MNLLNIEQRGPAWHKERLGNVTASRMADAMSYLSRASGGRKAGDSTQKRSDYILEKALERETGEEAWHPVTQPMQDGIDREEAARQAYYIVTGQKAEECGIAAHPKIKGLLASPDGLIGSEGIWEGKCPTQGVHHQYLIAKEVPPMYIPQCLTQLACLPDRDWLDFTSYHPNFRPTLKVFIAPRMYRKDWLNEIAEVEDAARKTLSEIATLTAELQALAESRKF